MSYEIESGIEMPKISKRAGNGAAQQTVAAMQPGQSVVVDKRTQVTGLMNAAKKAGKVMASRKTDDGKLRVWMVGERE